MKRIFYHYKLWEDHRNGLFATWCKNEEFVKIRVRRLLSDPKALKKYMQQVVDNWPKSAAVNLSNRGRNRQAWLGQAACCYYAKAPEYITKQA